MPYHLGNDWDFVRAMGSLTDLTFDVGESERFNVRVAAIIRSRGALLVGRSKGNDYWHLPGGRVQVGESSVQATVRELGEELGSVPTACRLAIVAENFFTLQKRRCHEIGFYFECNIEGDEGVRDPELGNRATEEHELGNRATSEHELGVNFAGPEGDTLALRWQPIDQLTAIDVRPRPVVGLLTQIPLVGVTHLVLLDGA